VYVFTKLRFVEQLLVAKDVRNSHQRTPVHQNYYTHTHIHKARTPNCHKLGLCCISLPASLLLLSWIGCGCGCGCGCLQHSLKEKKALLLQADNYIFVEN